MRCVCDCPVTNLLFYFLSIVTRMISTVVGYGSILSILAYQHGCTQYIACKRIKHLHVHVLKSIVNVTGTSTVAKNTFGSIVVAATNLQAIYQKWILTHCFCCTFIYGKCKLHVATEPCIACSHEIVSNNTAIAASRASVHGICWTCFKQINTFVLVQTPCFAPSISIVFTRYSKDKVAKPHGEI